MNKFATLVLLAPLALCGVGCGGSESDVTTESASTEQMKMTVLARVDRSPTNVITFLESPLGIVISETGRAEEIGKHEPLDSLRAQGMAAAYRALSNDDQIEVPAPLLAAESSWVARTNAELGAPAPKLLEPPPAPEARTDSELRGPASKLPEPPAAPEHLARGGETVGTIRSALGGASSDAAWWSGLPFCRYSNWDSSGMITDWVDGVWCATDVGWAQTGWRDTMYYEVTAFGQGNTANVVVNKWIAGSWQVVVNTTVAYRYFQTFSFPPENGAYFYSTVTGTGGQTIGIAERYRLAMPQPGFLNNNPSRAS